MNTIQPSIDPSSSCLADWLADAIDLVQRVNARLSKEPRPSQESYLRPGRQVLSDLKCLELAGLAVPDVTV